MTLRITDHTCLVCMGKIVEETVSAFDVTAGLVAIGPVSKDQHRSLITYHCGACGLQYKFPPKPEARAQAP